MKHVFIIDYKNVFFHECNTKIHNKKFMFNKINAFEVLFVKE